MVKAAQLVEYDGRDAIKINEAERPEPVEGEVLVEVYAASVNPFDYKLREGMMKDFINLQLPATLGGDFAGVIAGLGKGVEGLDVGQAVYGQANAAGGHGSWAEFAPVKAQSLAPKPRSLEFAQAAAAPLVSVSAYQALVETIQLKAGQRILVHGGAGGIGSMAIQLAKHLGAEVATTVSTKDKDFVAGLGADHIIDYKAEDFSTQVDGYDAVFDTVGGETNAKSYQVLKPGGKLVSMTMPPDEALSRQYQVEASSQQSRTTPARLEALAKLFDAGALKVQIDKIYPLEQTADALEYLKTGGPRGKVVVKVKAG